MKVAILETVKATAGFELEFDRIIIEGLHRAGHEPVLMVPQNTELDQDFGIPTYELSGGEIVSYDGAGKFKKIILSLQREARRVRWFDDALRKAKNEKIDAIILTTATYRYLRSLQKSHLKKSEIPVHFIFLGVNPDEKPKFLKKAKDCLPYPNIHLNVMTLRDDFGMDRLQNIKLLEPPVMVPDEIKALAESSGNVLKIGFFGHYRKDEKNIEMIIDTVKKANFTMPVRFILQMVPTTAADKKNIDEVIQKHEKDDRFTFITHKLLGDDWYAAIAAVDVVFLPYMAERYLYNWSAIYFTAIGCEKPVLLTKMLNPEVMEMFHVGEIIDLEHGNQFCLDLEQFVNGYDKKKALYKAELSKANRHYGKRRFIERLLDVGV